MVEFTERGNIVVETVSGGLIRRSFWTRQRWVHRAELTSS